MSMNKYFRFVFGMNRFFKTRISTSEALTRARATIEQRMKSRVENFLTLVEKGVFGYSKSPYLQLLQPKKISFSE